MQSSPLQYMPYSFFVVEAKKEDSLTKAFNLADYIPQGGCGTVMRYSMSLFLITSIGGEGGVFT
jgi:hypothetical protein